MILPWLLYGTGVGLLFAAAAWFLEIPLRERGWPVRWLWVTAIFALLLVPTIAALVQGPTSDSPVYSFVPAGEHIGAAAVNADVAIGSSRSPTAVPAPDRGFALERWVLLGWGLASATVAVAFGIALLSLWRSRRGWRRGVINGRTVWISRDTGPAVVGAFPGSVVIPEWLLGIPGEKRELILRHEEEHVAARDAPVLFFVLFLRILLPWNPALWWVGRSLRHAIEIDCDRRVLASGADARAYARVLLDVSERGTPHHFAVAALSEPPSFLERRIRLMISHPAPLRTPRVAATVALALVAAVAACRLDRPEAQPIVATGFSMPPAAAEPAAVDAAGNGLAAAPEAPSRPRLPAPSQGALADSIKATFRAILETRHPEVVSGTVRGERVNLYVLIDGNGDVLQSAVDTERRSGSCNRTLADGLGTELDRESIGSAGCGSLEAGVAGPSAVSYFWGAGKPETEQQRLAPTGPYQFARLLRSARPSGEMLVAAVRAQFPEVYERGLPQGETLWFVADAYHQVVHAGRGWEQPTSAAAEAEIQRILPGIALSGGLMSGIRSTAGTPIGIYWARLADGGQPASATRPDPWPAARTYAVTTREAGREVQIDLEGEAAADQSAFRIIGKFTNEGSRLTAITPFTFILMSAEPFQATLRLQGEGEMRVETEERGRRLRSEGHEVAIARASGEGPAFVLTAERIRTTDTPR